jgi:glycosyltransferase involved in cell wall biosynthesis
MTRLPGEIAWNLPAKQLSLFPGRNGHRNKFDFRFRSSANSRTALASASPRAVDPPACCVAVWPRLLSHMTPDPARSCETVPAPPVSPCLAVVVPVYNEAATIADVIRTVLRQPLVLELIVVDDGSTDGTWLVLQALGSSDPRIRIFRHEINRGKGAALRTGFARAVAPVVLVQDADLEYDPTEYGLLVKPILSGRADVVFGSRFEGAGAHRVLYYWHSFGNRFLTTLSNMCTNINLTDMETGYKAFRREVLQQISIEEDRFGFEPEITAKVSKLRLRIYEVPISYYGRTYAEGKKINWRDGVAALWCILKYNFCRRHGRPPE